MSDRVPSIQSASLLIPVTVAGGNFMTGLDQSVVITALPLIANSLGEQATALGLVLTAYIAALIIALPLGGWASDRFGARTAYLTAASLFTISSLLCGMSSNLPELVASRILQGVGGALMGTIGQVVVLSTFSRDRTLRINTFTTLASQIAPIIGPVVGGLLATYVSWRWIFYINLPIGIVVVLCAATLFPALKRPERRSLDTMGFFLVATGTVLLVFGMNDLTVKPLPGLRIVAELAAAAGLLSMAVRHCLTRANPVLDLRLLKIRSLRVSLLTGGGLDTIGLNGVLFTLLFLLQIGFGMTAAQAGSLTFLAAVGSVAIRLVMPKIICRFGFRTVLVANTPTLAVIVMSFILLTPSTPEWIIGGLIFIFGVLRSCQWSATGNLSYVDVPPEKLGHFSAIYFVLWQMAVAVGMGLSSALVSLLADQNGRIPLSAFHVSLAVEATIVLLAVVAYRTLRHDDGSAVSGHGR